MLGTRWAIGAVANGFKDHFKVKKEHTDGSPAISVFATIG